MTAIPESAPPRVLDFLRRPPAILINGEWSTGSGETFAVEDPSTAKTIGAAVDSRDEDVDQAVAAAEEARDGWLSAGYYGRYLLLNELADRIESHGDDLSFLDALDGGNPIDAMRHDVTNGVKQLRYMAALGLSIRGETMPADGARDIHLTFPEPYGVVARIIPFNHPAMFAMSKLAAPLISGNTVVLKPAEQTPLSALYLADLIRETLPPGVVNVITGGADAGTALVRDPRVKRIAFTGSVPTAQRIQAEASQVGIKHVTLELGGKNPMIVFPDADIHRAAQAAIVGMNLTVCQGQSCGSNSRIFVHRDIYRDYIRDVVERLKALRVGVAYDPGTSMGPVVSENQFQRVLRYIDLGLDDGGRVAFGGNSLRDANGLTGYFVAPTLIEGLEVEARMAREEIFGPVLSVFAWDDVDEVVADANSVSYGLTGSVWTRDLTAAHSVAHRLQAGYVWINEHGPHYIGTPFGGYKNSGVGKEEAVDEIWSYVQTKAIHLPLDK